MVPLDEKGHSCCQEMGGVAVRNSQVKDTDNVIKSTSFFLGNFKPSSNKDLEMSSDTAPLCQSITNSLL